MDNLEDLTPQKKIKIQNFIDTSEVVKRNEFQQSLASVDKKLKTNADTLDKLSVTAINQAVKLKQDVENLLRKKLSIFKRIKEENAKLLNDYSKDIYTKNEQFCHFIKECKDTVQTGSSIQVYDTEREVNSYSVRLPVPAIHIVSFRPNEEPLRSIEHAFGFVTTDQQVSNYPLTLQQRNATPKSARPKTSTRKHEQESQKQYTETHFRPTKVLADFTTSYPIGDITIVGAEAWTCCECLYTITLINNRGETKREVDLKGQVIGISSSPTTNNVWVQLYNGDIKEVTPNEIIYRFNTTAIAHSICVTGDDHILIGGLGEVRKLARNGKTVLKAKTLNFCQPRCLSPRRMSECGITGNIAMLNGDHHVLVIDKDFQELFMYKGVTPSDEKAIASAFRPVDVTYDITGSLVVCDHTTIRIISNDGKFLRQLRYDETLQNINSVCMDVTRILWVMIKKRMKDTHVVRRMSLV